jgi:hypothetical protein
LARHEKDARARFSRISTAALIQQDPTCYRTMAETDDTIAKIMARSGATREDASLALKRSGGDANKALMSLINQSAVSPSPKPAGVNAQNYSHGAESKRAHRPMTDDDDIVVRPEVPQREYRQGAFASKQNDNGEHHSLLLKNLRPKISNHLTIHCILSL